MEVIIKKIYIKNFKRLSELELDFTDKKNILEGENGIGKTTVLDAITWCLFGKNFADEKECAELEARKPQIKETIDSYNEIKQIVAKQNEEVRAYENLRKDLERNDAEQERLRNLNAEYQKTYDSSNIDVALLKENRIKEINNKIENVRLDIERLDLEKTCELKG